MEKILLIITAYFLGSIPFGLIFYRIKTGKDIRKEGSGNIGATNTFRTGGKLLGLATLFCDLFKGIISVLIAKLIFPNDIIIHSVTAAVAVWGHVFSIWLKFRGGKGVATALGVMLVIEPLLAAIAIVVFILICMKTRIVSLSSIFAVMASTIYAFLYAYKIICWLMLIILAIIIFSHKDNLIRIIKKEEKKIF